MSCASAISELLEQYRAKGLDTWQSRMEAVGDGAVSYDDIGPLVHECAMTADAAVFAARPFFGEFLFPNKDGTGSRCHGGLPYWSVLADYVIDALVSDAKGFAAGDLVLMGRVADAAAKGIPGPSA